MALIVKNINDVSISVENDGPFVTIFASRGNSKVEIAYFDDEGTLQLQTVDDDDQSKLIPNLAFDGEYIQTDF